MSESNLEQLLTELQLATPSEQLDDRVFACVSQSNHNVQPNGQVQPKQQVQPNQYAPLKQTNKQKSVLSIAIAAALFVGSVTGFLIAQTTHHTAENAAASFNANTESMQSAGMLSHVSKSTITTELAGPNVSAVCALVKFASVPQMRNTECQDCHSGLADSVISFRKSHLLLAEFETCSLCHAADVSLNSVAAETMF